MGKSNPFPFYDTNEVKAALLGNVEHVCQYLLPNGRRRGHHWVCGNIRGDPGESLKIALTGDKAGLWYDFADPSAGGNLGHDLIGLWMATRNLSFPDAVAKAGSWLIMPQRPTTPHRAASIKDKPLGAIVLPALDRGAFSELKSLRESRGLSTSIGMEILFCRGQFGIGEIAFANQKHRAWFITDASRYNAQVRRMDGKALPIGTRKTKAKTWQGSCAGWPIGAATITEKTRVVYLCEGGPDLLAAVTAVWLENEHIDECEAFVAMLGASQRIHSTALSLFAGKHVRIFGHNDESGREAVIRWGLQLLDAHAAKVERCISDIDGEDLNDYISRHSVNGSLTYASWPDKLGVDHAAD